MVSVLLSGFSCIKSWIITGGLLGLDVGWAGVGACLASIIPGF